MFRVFSRVNLLLDNQPQKSLAFSIFQNGYVSENVMASEISTVFDINCTKNTVKNWIPKFNTRDKKGKLTFNSSAFKDFLTIKKGNKLSFLSDESIYGFVKYEFGRKQSVVDAAKRINNLFEVSLEVSFALSQVEVNF